VFRLSSKTGTFHSFDIENTLHCGMRWCSQLRHHGTSWKVTGSIPNGANVIFHWRDPPGLTMVLRSAWPPTEMGTRIISWGGWRRPVRRADNLTTYMWRLSWNLGGLNLLEPSGTVQPCNGIALPYIFIYLFRFLFVRLDEQRSSQSKGGHSRVAAR